MLTRGTRGTAEHSEHSRRRRDVGTMPRVVPGRMGGNGAGWAVAAIPWRSRAMVAGAMGAPYGAIGGVSADRSHYESIWQARVANLERKKPAPVEACRLGFAGCYALASSFCAW